MNTDQNQNEITVGVDTGKSQLEIYIRPLDIFFTVNNDDKGVQLAIKEIKTHHPTRIVIEATGRLEYLFISACAKNSLPFIVANPIHVRRFAGAIGQLAKTDKLDAQLIAHYGESIKPPLSTLKPHTMQDMSDLIARRKQLITLQTMEKNRLQIMPKELASSITPVLTVIGNQIDKVDQKLQKIIACSETFKAKNKILQSMPGVGNVVALSLLSNMPELGCISNREAAALIGVAPINRESGRYQGHRKIRGGRHQIRTAMFMAMLSAIQCNPVFKATYNRLVRAGKPKKIAIIACIRKMIVILNSMVRDGVPWNPEMAR